MPALRGDVHFAWVGDIQFVLKTYLGPQMEQAAATGRFHRIPFTSRIAEYFAAADVFALTSREDPYPTVVMEALACGVPCVAFDGTGGIAELLLREKRGQAGRYR
jgi:glycosyltransferase involved in cell wall biosynthesis